MCFYCNAVFADAEVITQFEYYNISPQTKYEIKDHLQKNTPIVYDKIKFHGSTSWQVEWHFTWKKSNNICYIASNTTKLKVLFKMPRISPNMSVNSAVTNAFNGYFNALLDHEKGHMKNGNKALTEIKQMLANFHSYSDCHVLNEAVNNAITKVIEKYQQQDITYDLQTKHGELQGVLIKKFL